MKMHYSFTLKSYMYALLGACILLTTACKKDKETPTSVPDCLLTKYIYGDATKDFAAYIYDANNNLIKGDRQNNNYTTLEYDANNRVVKQVEYKNNKLTKTAVVEYNAQSYWSKITVTYSDNSTEIITAAYDSNGNRIKITTSSSTRVFEYSGGNLIKKTRTSIVGNTTYTNNYEYYLDKENRLNKLEELFDLGYAGTPSKNLIKKETSNYGDGSESDIDTYMYELNAKGYPTKKTLSSNSDRNGDGIINSADDFIASFEYQCK